MFSLPGFCASFDCFKSHCADELQYVPSETIGSGVRRWAGYGMAIRQCQLRLMVISGIRHDAATAFLKLRRRLLVQMSRAMAKLYEGTQSQPCKTN